MRVQRLVRMHADMMEASIPPGPAAFGPQAVLSLVPLYSAAL